MKQRITYLIPNTPQGEKNKAKTVTVISEEEDRGWTHFVCDDHSKLSIPTHWISQREDI